VIGLQWYGALRLKPQPLKHDLQTFLSEGRISCYTTVEGSNINSRFKVK